MNRGQEEEEEVGTSAKAPKNDQNLGSKWGKVLLLVAKRGYGGGGGATTPVVSWTAAHGDPFLSFSLSSSSSRKLGAALWEFQHYFSPASGMYPSVKYGELAPNDRVTPPNRSIELKARVHESSYTMKTSTKLLKVLNRICTLEERNTANRSLVEALKTELDHAHSRIKDLLRDHQESKREIGKLLKRISEVESNTKTEERDRVHGYVQSIWNELDDEKKLRRRSESLHRKLERELFEFKVALSNIREELDRERKSRVLAEELCDELAKGVKEYGQMADYDSLILHLSESWLDERMQMQERESRGGVKEKALVVEKLRDEIESFIQTRLVRNTVIKDNKPSPRDSKETRIGPQSLESIPEEISASR